MSLDAAHDLVAGGMHFPAGPGFFEPVERDEPALVKLVAVPLIISLVPAQSR